MDDTPSPGPDAPDLEAIWEAGDARAVLETVMTFVPGVVFVVSAPSNTVVYVSEFAGRLVGRPRQELEGLPYARFAELFPAYATDGRLYSLDERPMTRALKGEATEEFEGVFLDAGGGRVLLRCNSVPIRDAGGALIGAIAACSDIRREKAREEDLRQTAEYNKALHGELAHRVKNHLMVISGLIATEARNAPTATADFARKIMGVMQGLASVYDSITNAGGTAEAEVDAHAFVDAVCRAYRTDDIRIEVETPRDLKLDSVRAASLGALVNEAVCNSYKYAYPDGRGCIEVSLTREPPDALRLQVLDRGVGRAAAPGHGPSHGSKLMEMLARQLGGRLVVEDRPGGGTAVCVQMPEHAPPEIAGEP